MASTGSSPGAASNSPTPRPTAKPTAKSWADLDPEEYAFTRSVADPLRDHDDREEFLVGIDLIVTGITGITELR
ncbi:hypothetical protein [Streptomyces sp. SID12501]|uniref:hypothetical protein n=1 Tax=Streptomyces sp. SID12501 TaxID=2706042 RepID=UPI001EF2C576|nr:hypothetical protein [Streptomyces sp. SID12501]